MQRFALVAICLLQIVLSVSGNGHYSVIGPGTIHPEHKYTVAVAVHDTTEPSQLKIGITGPSFNKTEIVELKTADEVKLIDFDVPELEQGVYNLTAEGVSGIQFYNTTKLNLEVFEPHVLIQTDKGAYKPGDVVNFRVIFLDENLRPSKIKNSVVVWFEDSKRNRVKEFKNLDVVKGVYTGKFQISEFPVLGNWRIISKTKADTQDSIPLQPYNYGNNKVVYFDVKKYVLPKYVVKVEATERFSVLDGDFHAVVRANYTFGKPVNGKTTLLLEAFSYSEGTRKETPRFIKTADMVNGKSKFDFSVKDLQSQIHEKYPTYLHAVATVEEEFTGVKINYTAASTLYPYRYTMYCNTWEKCSIYHADEEMEVVYEVQNVDGTKVQDTKSVLRLIYTETITESWQRRQKSGDKEPAPKPNTESPFVFESHLNASGQAVFKIKLPDLAEIEDFNHFFKVELQYAEQKDEVNSANPYRPPEKNDMPRNEEPKDYFKLEVEREKDKWSIDLKKEATVLLNSSEPFKYFVYTIVGRGNILEVKRIVLPEATKVHKFKFQPTLLMAPHAQIYVHYVENGVLHYSENTFNAEYKFLNKIDIKVPAQVKVGEDVELQITTAPNSFVGLLAVDQSVLLLKEYNDVHERDLNWQLGTYSTRTPDQGGYSSYPGGSSGVVTLTNANYFYNWTVPWYLGNAQPLSAIGLKTQLLSTPASPQADSVGGFGGAAGPPGASAESASAALAPPVRKDFQETWIFDNIESTTDENITWIKKIPDTITSWVITGFSLNPEKGFATTKDKTYVKAFQPFFVSVRLPYSVKRGEVISVPALVFNYLEKDLDVDVTLENTDNEFEFTEASNEVLDVPSRTKTVRVPSNSAKGVSFMIRPTVIGNNLLKFKATSPLAGDAIHKPLKVVPEGITEYANRAYFVNLKDSPELVEKFELELPEDIVPDSEHAEFAVVGDLLGPLLNNLDSLVRLPSGCGEQTMSKFVPNLLVLRYLKSTKNLTPALESRIRLNLERGYQNMLSYRHTDDGSFSSFGPGETYDHKPRNGSTWLTAYVTRFLQFAVDYIKVDPKIIEQGLSYLTQRQAANGSFTEAGEFFYRSQSNEVSLTASVLLAYLAKDQNSMFLKQLDAGFKFISENLEKTEDLRAKALAIYTLQQGKHPSASKHLADIKAKAKTDDERMWWTSTSDKNLDVVPYYSWWRWPHSEEVEVTSYVMLTLLDEKTETIESVLPVLKWLVAQRNNYGGFSSTQDTIVGLQALIKFAEKSGYEPAVMDIKFETKGKARTKTEQLDVNKENGLLLQSFELPVQTRSIDFQAKGKGAALVQISYQYNIYEKEKKPSFTLTTVINEETPKLKLEFDVCVEYVGADGESNMAILEIALPSGYVADTDSYEEIRKVERVRLVESKNSDTTVTVYFESLRKSDVKCLTIDAFKSFAVALQKPSPVVVYDYYDTSKKATTYYEVASKLCEICDKEEEDCQKACGL